MEPELWHAQYRNEYCPVCRQRACITQHRLYDECRVPRCLDAQSEADFHCARAGCCHGCECERAGECPLSCRCDCHYQELVIVAPQPAPLCLCYACANRLDCPVQPLANGYRVTRRPRHCALFAALGPNVVSSHYNNEDGRNARLEHYFPPVPRASRAVSVIEIMDDEDDNDVCSTINTI